MGDRTGAYLPSYAHAVLPEEIHRQRALGWPDIHPEDVCHRCGRRNLVWHVDYEHWATATRNRERGDLDILCPSCFAELYQAETGMRIVWEMRLDERSADWRRHHDTEETE